MASIKAVKCKCDCQGFPPPAELPARLREKMKSNCAASHIIVAAAPSAVQNFKHPKTFAKNSHESDQQNADKGS